jgi:hypothetical protein
MSKGRPVYAIMLLRSDVRNDIGLDSVGALDTNGGEPQSSSVCSSPGDIVEMICAELFCRVAVEHDLHSACQRCLESPRRNTPFSEE